MSWLKITSYAIGALAAIALIRICVIDRTKYNKSADKDPLDRRNYRLLFLVAAFDLVGMAIGFYADYHAPRHIRSWQRAILADRLGVFKGQKFRVVEVGWDDKEAAGYAMEIAATLRNDCGWSGEALEDVPPGDKLQQSAGVGVLLSLDDVKTLADPTKAIWPAVRSLDRAMDDAGITTKNQTWSPGEPMVGGTLWPITGYLAIPAGTIQITVGKNPDAE
jgi:hypothetical protein